MNRLIVSVAALVLPWFAIQGQAAEIQGSVRVEGAATSIEGAVVLALSLSAPGNQFFGMSLSDGTYAVTVPDGTYAVVA